jgi:hypothetical protein
VYDFQQTDLRKQFKVQQISENGVIGVVKDNTYKYRGVLETSDDKSGSDMTVKFPLSEYTILSHLYSINRPTYSFFLLSSENGIYARNSSSY